MSRNPDQKSRTKRFTPVGIIFAVLGLLLFAYFVKRAGVSEIIAGIKRLGAGFLLVLLISGLRPVVRILAWMRSLEGEHQLRFRDAFKAYLVGDALGTLLPLGLIVSEPTKAALVRKRVPLVAGLSALAVENLFYSLSVALFIFAGTVALLLSFQLPKPLRLASIGALSVILAVIPLAYFVIRKQWKFVSGALEYLYGRGLGRKLLETRRERVRSIEDRIYGFYAGNRSRFLPILLLEACFHLAGVAEVYVTLYFISDVPPTLLTAFVLESINRIINVVFKFVPMRVGVDEAGTGMLTKVLQLGTASGVTLAIIRKARVIFWAALGIAFLIRRGLSLRAVAEDTQQALAAEVEAERGGAASILPAGESQ
ncbi:MAG TPA: lysylphosphatidylglycerol synthase domain-containing protein [Pyrinomonadaceae bacterium]